VLLDIIHNQYEFKKEPYEKVQELAKLINCECKTIYKEFDNIREFHKWYIENTDEEDLSKWDIEGVVIECDGIMTKLKFPYYNFWKSMRGLKDKVKGKNTVRLASLYNAEANYFYAWLKQQDEQTLEKDIITVRKMFKDYQL
jgi:tRNA splicing ligase